MLIAALPTELLTPLGVICANREVVTIRWRRVGTFPIANYGLKFARSCNRYGDITNLMYSVDTHDHRDPE